MGSLRGRILQFVASWSLDQGKNCHERLESSHERTQEQDTEHGDEIPDEETPSRSLDSSVEADVDNQTNAERLQRAVAMSMMGENDKDEIGSFKATSVQSDEANETDQERLQRALSMSMVGGNDNDEIGSFNTTSLEPGEGNEADEDRLQSAQPHQWWMEMIVMN